MTELKNLLKNHQKISLIGIKGIGGIGKSTVAKAFFLQNCLEFDFFLFLDGKSDLYSTFHETTLIANLDLEDKINKIPFETPNRNQLIFERVQNALTNLKGTKLLLIDNAPPDNTHRLQSLAEADWKIMTTSRQKMDFMHAYEIEQATPEDAVAIFWVYYADKKPYSEAEKAEISKIVHRLAFHPLMIELVAKNAKDLLWTLEEINQKLAEKGLNIDQDTDIATMHNSQERVRDILGYLLQIFPLDRLETQERHLLSLYSVLPALPLTKKYWAVLLGETEDTWQKRSLALHRKGWISQHDHTFEIHALLAEIIRLQSPDRLYQDCEKMIDFLIVQLNWRDNPSYHQENYKYTSLYSLYAESTSYAFNLPYYNIAFLLENIGNFYEDIGNLDKSMLAFEKSKLILEELVQREPNNLLYKHRLGVVICWIGINYQDLGNLEKALIFYERYNNIEKELYLIDVNSISYKNDLAVSYSKLGEIHDSLGNLEKALEFFEKDTQLTKELYESYPTSLKFKDSLGWSYHFLGIIHVKLGELKKGLEFYGQMKQIFEELSKEYPTNVNFQNGLGASYQKLGYTHMSLNSLEKSLNFFEKSKILTKELYESYPLNVEFKNNLATLYVNLSQLSKTQNNIQQAHFYFKEAEKLWEELVRDAPQVVQFQHNLAQVRKELGRL